MSDDMQTDTMMADALRQLLTDHCTPAVVRQIELETQSGGAAGAGPGPAAAALWQTLEGSGFVDALVPEAHGGAGLTLAQGFGLFALCGRFLLPLPLPAVMVARAWCASQGSPQAQIAINNIANYAQLTREMSGFGDQNARNLQASLIAAQMAGALQAVLAMTLQYANDRQQFGRPIGKFQAIQHQLAVMAEQAMAAGMAAQLGCSRTLPLLPLAPEPLNAAVAKARASEAAVEVAALAHSIFGAIGFTAEHDLQLYTRRLHQWRQEGGSESHWHDQLGAHLVLQHAGTALDALRHLTDLPATDK